jgi:hypothetical protein
MQLNTISLYAANLLLLAGACAGRNITAVCLSWMRAASFGELHLELHVDGIKDLWCSSTVRLLSTQTWIWQKDLWCSSTVTLRYEWKGLWCSSTVWLLTTQTRMNVTATVHVRLSLNFHVTHDQRWWSIILLQQFCVCAIARGWRITHIHTKVRRFLVYMIHVGLASACPSYSYKFLF